MTPILVTYGTKHGSTIEVAEAIATELRSDGGVVDVTAAAEVRTLDGYSAVVLGGALYMGRLHADAAGFLKRNRHALAEMPLAVFALGPKTMAAGEVAASRKQLEHALADVPEVTPVEVTIFGGVVDPSQLRFPFKRMPGSDARDWNAISAWGRGLALRFADDLEAVPA